MICALSALLAIATLGPVPQLFTEPYLQVGSSAVVKDVVVVWHDLAGATPRQVEFRQGPGEWAKAAPGETSVVNVGKVEPHEVRRAVVKGLSPGRPFEYRIVSEGREISRHWGFAPPGEGQKQTFAVIGDCGGASAGQAAVAYQAGLLNPQYVMIPGDIVYDDGTARDYRLRLFPFYQRSVPSERRGSDLWHRALTIGVLGNHDIGSRNLDRDPDGLAFFHYFDQPRNGWSGVKEPVVTGAPDRIRAFQQAAGDRYPVMANFWMRMGDVHWVMIDVNHYVNLREPALRQWVTEALAAGKDAKWRIVMLHHPPFHSSRKHAEATQSRLLMDLFEEGKVDVVIAGHVHNYQRNHPVLVGAKKGATREELNKNDWTWDTSFDGKTNTQPKGIVTIVNGAGGASLYDVDLADKPASWKPFTTVYKGVYSFGFVTVEGGKLSYQQRDGSGAVIDEWVITK